MNLSKRVAKITPSATLRIAETAKELRRNGIDILDFSVGEPDFPVQTEIQDAAIASIKNNESTYSPTAGLFDLRDTIARQHGVDTDQVIVTNGGKEAFYLLFQTLLNPDDEVIMPSPYWVSYAEEISLAGGKTIEVHTDSKFHIDLKKIDAAITEKTKIIVLNSPANPTGAVQPQSIIDGLVARAKEKNILLVLDEVYQSFLYDDLSVAHPLASSNVLIIDSVSKSHCMTGWRVGWAVGEKKVIDGMITLKSHLSSNTPNAMQRGALAALTGEKTSVQKMKAVFQKRRDMLCDGINEIDGFSVQKPEGAFYAFIDCTKIMEEKNIETAEELSLQLLHTAHIAVVPGSAFGSQYNNFIRLSFAAEESALTECIARLQAFAK